MIRRLAWAWYGAVRRMMLGGLSEQDRTEMDDLIRARLRGARGRTLGVTRVWLREFGDLFSAAFTHRADRHHERRGGGMMRGWTQDLAVAARSLARRPGFSAGVALTLGLGIGATTTIYSVVDGVMLRPLPYEDASRLVAIGGLAPGGEWLDPGTGLQNVGMISMPNYLDFIERSRSLDRVAAIEPNRTVLPDQGYGPDMVTYARVSPDMLEMLGATPELGRLFAPDEYGPGAPEVVVLSHEWWRTRFGADPEALGRPAMPGGNMTVVGVLPPDFRPPEAFFPDGELPAIWFPIQGDPTTSPSWYDRRRGRFFLLGRLSEGTSLQQAREEAGRVAADLAAEYPQDNIESDGSAAGIGVNRLHAQTVGATGRGLALFLGAAGLLLLLAAMNAATLLLARALDRSRELGVRLALGAGRARVVRLLLAEATILAFVGGVIGIALAYGGVRVFLSTAPGSIPRLGSIAVDSRVLAVALAVSLGTGLLAGLVPAARLARRGPWERLRSASRTFADTSTRLRSVLVGGQMAVAIVLLSGAALLFNSFVRMRTVEPGFEPDGLIALLVESKGGAGWNFQEQWQGWDRLLEELRTVPGLESVALASRAPFRLPNWRPRLLMPGDPPETVREDIAGYLITPGYLETMGTRLLSGRDFDAGDGPTDERVALVNETFVRLHLGGEDPIGETIRWSAGTEWSPGDEWIPPREWLDGEPTPIRIVGLVEDVVQASVAEGPRAAIYVPYTQGRGGPTAVIRTSRAAADVLPELRQVATRYNPRVPILDFGTAHDRIAATQVLPRFQTVLVGAFAVVAMLLAAAGLYGSLAHAVGRRRRELGVRMALGADRAGVLRLVLRQGMALAAVGTAVGLIAAVASTRVLAGFLYGVQPNDPATLATAAAGLLLVSALACLVPARMATHVDPVRVLNSE